MAPFDTKLCIARFKNVHGNRYDYSLVCYKNSKDKVTIICKSHGSFKQSPTSHLKGQGCLKCAVKKRELEKLDSILKKKFKGLVQPKDYKLIPLTKGKFAKVDNEDFDKLKCINWTWSSGYVDGKIPMHRYIMNCPSDKVVDHINHDTLDNRKCNLRICTQQENNMNQSIQENKASKYKGVTWDNRSCNWRCRITFNKKIIDLGRFYSEIEAAKAYDTKALELFGEFAYLNVQQFKELVTKEIVKDE